MRAVDTNVLVRLMTRDDAKQAAAAESFVAHGAWVPYLAVAEATWVLASVYDREPAAIATALEMLLTWEKSKARSICNSRWRCWLNAAACSVNRPGCGDE